MKTKIDDIKWCIIANYTKSKLPIIFKRRSSRSPLKLKSIRHVSSNKCFAASCFIITVLIAVDVYAKHANNVEFEYFSADLSSATVELARFKAQTSHNWVRKIAIVESSKVSVPYSIESTRKNAISIVKFADKSITK